jgi:oligosaccharide repeat unit polymerase
MQFELILPYIISITINLLALFILKNKFGDILRCPASLLSMLWIVLFTLHALCVLFQITPLFPMTLHGAFYISLAIISFIVPYIIMRDVFNSSKIQTSEQVIKLSNAKIKSIALRESYLDWVLAFYSVFVMFAFYFQATSIINSIDVFSNLQLLRYRLSYDDASWGISGNMSLSVFALTAYLAAKNEKNDENTNWPLIIAFLSSIFMATVSTQRTSLLLVLVSALFAFNQKRSITYTQFLLMILFFILSFSLYSSLVGKTGDIADSLTFNLSSGLRSFSDYLLLPLSAFDYSKPWENSVIDPGTTYRFFTKFLQSFSLYQGNIPSLIMPEVDVPLTTNVYTFAHASLIDFGILFVLYFTFLGALYGFMFANKRASPDRHALMGFMFYPIIMSVFQDQFGTLASTWFQIIVYIKLLNVFYRVARSLR